MGKKVKRVKKKRLGAVDEDSIFSAPFFGDLSEPSLRWDQKKAAAAAAKDAARPLASVRPLNRAARERAEAKAAKAAEKARLEVEKEKKSKEDPVILAYEWAVHDQVWHDWCLAGRLRRVPSCVIDPSPRKIALGAGPRARGSPTAACCAHAPCRSLPLPLLMWHVTKPRCHSGRAI